jgi:pyrroline-5-carboxylate reductase
MNTLFIGGGNMGRALIGGLLKKGFDPKSISTVETDPQIAAHLVHDFSIDVLSTLVNAQEQLNAAQVVIIAVKPQDFKSIALELSHLLFLVLPQGYRLQVWRTGCTMGAAFVQCPIRLP